MWCVGCNADVYGDPMFELPDGEYICGVCKKYVNEHPNNIDGIIDPAKKRCRRCTHYHYVKASPTGTSQSGAGCLLSGGRATKVCDDYKKGR